MHMINATSFARSPEIRAHENIRSANEKGTRFRPAELTRSSFFPLRPELQALASESEIVIACMAKGVGGLMSPWMEVAPALLVPARNRSPRCPGLETIAEDQEAEDLDDDDE
ncbi:hypothetical protein NL676_002841 [Syzygium grande]|nr:hypothetical protein NL676_002841 [Syzygium grande]